MKDDSWTEKEEIFLAKIEQQCNEIHKHNTVDYTYYNKLASRFNIPILVISALNSLCAIALNDFLAQRYVSILNAILSAGTGVLGSVQLYMKLNEKMTNALRASILMKRLALKISKELSIEREKRTSEGQAFLQECFADFNTALEQGNVIEKKISNHLSVSSPSSNSPKKASFVMNMLSPKHGSRDGSREGSMWRVPSSPPDSIEEEESA